MTEEDVDMEDSAGDDDDGHVFKVDEILGTKVKKNVRYYKVRWTDTWETEENLHECQEAIDAFWERTGGKDKAKPAIVVNTEDPRTGKAFPLRQSKEEQSVSSKKRRKGTSKKSQRLKKRKLQENQSSSDEENDDEDENTDATGGKSSSLPSPQIGMKKVKRLKSKKVKNVNKELFGSEDGGMTDDGDDGDDEDESVPLKQLVASAHTTKTQGDENSMQAEGLPEEAPVFIPSGVDGATELSETGSGLAPQSTENVSCSLPQVPEGAGILDDSQSIKPSANEATAAVQDEVLSAAVSSATSETTAASVTTTTTTTTAAATTNEERCLPKQRLGKGTKWDAVICSSGSDDESQESTFTEVKVKEEPVSEEEEVQLFKRSSKLKAQLILSRYNQTGGDANVDGDDFIPDIIRREEDAVINQHIHAELPPLLDDSESNVCEPSPHLQRNSLSGDVPLSSEALFHTRLEPTLLSEPCISVEPLRVSSSTSARPTSCPAKKSRTPTRSRTSVSQRQSHGTVSTTSLLTGHSNTLSSPRQILSTPKELTTVVSTSSLTSLHLSAKEKIKVTAPSCMVSTGTIADEGIPTDVFDYAVSNVENALPVKCVVPISSLDREGIKQMVARVLYLLKQLIEHLKLPYDSVQEYMRALLMKSVVVAIRETYNGNNYKASFLEEQIHQFSKVILKELPLDKLAPLLTRYAKPYTSSEVVACNSVPTSSTDAVASSPRVSHLTPSSTVNHGGLFANKSNLDPHSQVNETMFSQKNGLENSSSSISMENTIVDQSDNRNLMNKNSDTNSNDSRNKINSTTTSNNSNHNSNHNRNHNSSININKNSNSTQNSNVLSHHNSTSHSQNSNNTSSDKSSETNSNSVMDNITTNNNGNKNNDAGIHNNEANKLLNLKDSMKKNTARKTTVVTSPSVTKKLVRDSSEEDNKETSKKSVSVLGPHKFYRPPSKMKAKKTSAGVASLSGDALLSGGAMGDVDVRYKDRVNKIFAAKLAANKPAKVVLTVDSDSDDTSKSNEGNKDGSDSSD